MMMMPCHAMPLTGERTAHAHAAVDTSPRRHQTVCEGAVNHRYCWSCVQQLSVCTRPPGSLVRRESARTLDVQTAAASSSSPSTNQSNLMDNETLACPCSPPLGTAVQELVSPAATSRALILIVIVWMQREAESDLSPLTLDTCTRK
jgi:hypothetical protein